MSWKRKIFSEVDKWRPESNRESGRPGPAQPGWSYSTATVFLQHGMAGCRGWG